MRSLAVTLLIYRVMLQISGFFEDELCILSCVPCMTLNVEITAARKKKKCIYRYCLTLNTEMVATR